MKIVGGLKKGRTLKAAKKGLRPTRALVREAIFNIIQNKIPESEVLDIFAGSGALGLEALSRGAKTCIFIERQPKTLVKNINTLSLKKNTKIIGKDFRAALRKIREKKFDVILLDPPYRKKYLETTLNLIVKYTLLKTEGVIVAEHSADEEIIFPEQLSILKRKHYGNTTVTFFEKQVDKEKINTE